MASDTGGMNNLGVVAVAITSLGGLILAYINARVSKETALLNSDDGIRRSLQEQIVSLSTRLEAEIEHRNSCEEEKTDLRRNHDKEIEQLISEHRLERHALRAELRLANTRMRMLLTILDSKGIIITEEELTP